MKLKKLKDILEKKKISKSSWREKTTFWFCWKELWNNPKTYGKILCKEVLKYL